ncbi:hypothetical protein AB205_0001030, partial [Aquarana catesbeiana]
QEIKTAEVIKCHQKKALFVGKKYINFIWVQHRTTAQLSVKVTQSSLDKNGLVMKGLNKENKNLKRISMLYMAKLGPEVITEEINLDDEDTPSDSDSGEVCTSLDCQQKVKGLHEQVLSAQEEKKAVSLELEELRSQLVDLIEENHLDWICVITWVNATKKENVMLTKEVFDQRKLLEKYNRVSVLAVEEYEDLQNSLEMEKDLRERAEKLAHEMIIEQNKLKRQSCLLLQECAPSEQMLNALEENARLTQLLEESRIQHQQKCKSSRNEYIRLRIRHLLLRLLRHLSRLLRRPTPSGFNQTLIEVTRLLFTADEKRSLMSIIRKKPSQASSSVKKEIASQSESATVPTMIGFVAEQISLQVQANDFWPGPADWFWRMKMLPLSVSVNTDRGSDVISLSGIIFCSRERRENIL